MAAMSVKRMEPLKILLVDDDEGICDALSKIMSSKGYVVTSKNSASEAIKALHTSSYDVLLTDLAMPQINGIELLKLTVKMAPTMVRIIMTGYGDVSTYLHAIDIGASEYINKPVKANELEAIIKKLIREKRKGSNESKFYAMER
jgi:DNA-binding NtrC family response regulator